MAGVKETNELMVAVFEIALLAAKQLKDGIQFADAEAFYAAFMQNIDFKSKVIAGWEGRQQIKDEVGDLDATEGIQLGMTAIQYVPKIVAALKKDA